MADPDVASDKRRFPMLSAAVDYRNIEYLKGMVSTNDGDRTREHGVVPDRNVAVQVRVASHIAPIPERDPSREHEEGSVKPATVPDAFESVQEGGLKQE